MTRMETNIKKYGGLEGYKAEMSRRAKMRKTKALPFNGRGYLGHLKDTGQTEKLKELSKAALLSKRQDKNE